MSLKNLKEMLARGIQGSVIGIFIIHTIGVIMMLLNGETATFTSDFLITQYISSAIVGFAFGALNMLFQSNRLSMLTATIIHCIGVAIVYFPCAIRARWFVDDINSIISTSIIFIGMYFIIWIFCYIQMKIYIKNINLKLDSRRK